MFWRLFGVFGVLLLASIGLLGFISVNRVEGVYLDHVESSLRTKAILVREVVRDRALQGPALQNRMMALREEIATRITIIADDGRVLADSEEDPNAMENHANRPEVRAARASQTGRSTRFSSTLGLPMMYFALRIDPGDLPPGFVRVALPLDGIQEQLAGLHRLVWTAAALTGCAAMILAFWLARRITQPLQELTRGAERIAAGNFGHKVYAANHDEVGMLAQSFNRMSECLAVQFAQLQEDRQQLRAILSGMVEGVVALDADQHILFANGRAAQLLEFQIASAVGRKFWEVVRKRSLQQIVQRAQSAPEPCLEELTVNGRAFKSLAVHAAQLPGPPARGVVLVFHDTSELRRLERLRQEFVANVSHELKTPLSVIKACVETLVDGAIDDPNHRGPFLEQIGDQADRLHNLILDLLSLARIESGTEAFEVKEVILEEAVQACLERHRARAAAKNQILESVPPASSPAHPLSAWADEEAVGQILDNLVDNALKYTLPGGRILVRWKEEDGQVLLEIEDTGIGIPERDLPFICERFYRVDKARSRELGGTGLGLSIVKHLVQAMKGSIQASSRPGQGSNFVIRLPKPA